MYPRHNTDRVMYAAAGTPGNHWKCATCVKNSSDICSLPTGGLRALEAQLSSNDYLIPGYFAATDQLVTANGPHSKLYVIGIINEAH